MKDAELLQPPPPRIDLVISSEQREARIQAARIVAMLELMSGAGDFWNDCHESIYNAVRDALANEKLFHEDRWALVLAAIWKEGMRYADAVAEDTD